MRFFSRTRYPLTIGVKVIAFFPSKYLGCQSILHPAVLADRVLVTGATGMVGNYVFPILSFKYEVYGISRTSKTGPNNIINCDLSQYENVARVLDNLKPEVIVNLAAHTDIDACEVDRETAWRINKDLVTQLCVYTQRHNCFLLHVSTDYVFDGAAGSYDEGSVPNPINWYGITKFEAEKEVAKLPNGTWCIARTSTVFGLHPRRGSFPTFILDRIKREQSVKALTNQYVSSTYALNLAQMLDEIIAKKVNGILHTAGSSRLSRYEQALTVCKEFGLNESLIEKTSEITSRTKRPQNTTLDVHKVTRLLKNKPITFDEGIRQFAKELKEVWRSATY